jgi:hypothetical protein
MVMAGSYIQKYIPRRTDLALSNNKDKNRHNYLRAVYLIVIPIHYHSAPYVQVIAAMDMFMVMIIQ